MSDTTARPRTAVVPKEFPIGYHSLHPDASMNFQMNRWFGWVGEPEMLEEMRMAAPRIATYADWKREFLALAERASQQGRVLRAGFYWRSAEFFMRADDPERKSARESFLGALRSVYGLGQGERHAVPYTDGRHKGLLPAYRFKPLRAKGTIVFFGGFDSYIEELTSAFVYLRDAGYDVIAFDGPGQGGALNESGLPMTAEWHKPVSAVLDYFEAERVTLVGLSLGGCLVLRAAASEPRVERVVAYDVLTNFLDVNLRQTNVLLRGLLKILLRLGAARMVNGMVARVARKSPVVQWGIQQGMHVTGTASAFEFLQRIKQFRTADVSASIRQDVLLLAGSEDHFVPVKQWRQQRRMLKNAHSISARLFTPGESAQNHCQVGNYGLALRTIVNWLDGMPVESVRDFSRKERLPMTSGDSLQFDMKRVTTPLLIHLVGKELRFPRLFLLRCKLTLNQFKRRVDRKFPREFVDFAALPAWVYLNLKKRIGPQKAFEIMRVVLLTGGTAIQNLQFDTVNKQRSFQNFADLELENNRSGIVRWNTLELVERTSRRFEIKITRCVFHEFAVSLGLGELTPVVCQIDNAMFNSYLPDAMIFDRGGSGRRIADGKRECTFVWELRDAA